MRRHLKTGRTWGWWLKGGPEGAARAGDEGVEALE
jgi:hypothetical protein